MATSINNTSELQSASRFLASLGSFWTESFYDGGVLQTRFATENLLNRQSAAPGRELLDCLSRKSVPATRTLPYRLLTIQKSQGNTAQVAPITFGSGRLYNDGLLYGQAAELTRYRYPIPADLVNAPLLADRPAAPVQLLSSGVEFSIKPGQYIEFVRNPFSGDFVTRSSSDEYGNLDESIDLWLIGSNQNTSLAYDRFGFALGLPDTCTELYSALLNSYFESLSIGPSSRVLRTLFAAACGLPVCQGAETVEALVDHPLRYQVITDQNVYDFPAGSTPTIAVGQELAAGDLLTDALRLYQSSNPAETYAGLTGLQVSSALLEPSLKLTGSLTFLNQSVAAQYALDASRNAIVTFTGGVTGAGADTTAFWNFVATQGATTGYSIANALRRLPRDDMSQPLEDPPAGQVLEAVNPMLFLIEHLFGASLVILQLRTDYLPDAAWSENLLRLRQCLPPHLLLLSTTGTVASL